MPSDAFQLAMHALTIMLPPILLEWWLGGWRKELQARARGEDVRQGPETSRPAGRTLARVIIALVAAAAVARWGLVEAGTPTGAALTALASALGWLTAFAIWRERRGRGRS